MGEKSFEEKKETKFKTVLGILPQFSILILLLSLVNQIIYYKRFALPIKYFTGFSELGLLVSDDLFLTVLGLFFLIYYGYQYYSDISVPKSKTKEKKASDINPILIFSILVIIIFSLFISQSYVKDYSLKLLLWFFIFFFFAAVIFHLWLTLERTILGDRLALIVGVTSLTIASLLAVTGFNIERVEDGKYDGTIIKTEDSSYVSNRESFFIGKSEKYVFIYNTKDTSTLVIPTESIKQMRIKSK